MLHIPIGLNLSSIGVTAEWWLESAQRIEQAGFGSAWIWDHFISRGRLDDPVLECWSTLAAATQRTSSLRLGSFVTNVMNRHPAVLARIVATTAELAPGRVELGIGSGGHPAEHTAYGIDFPPRPVRGEHLVEAMEVLRRLFTGGPVDYEGRHYRLEGAHAYPRPTPVPRIILGGETPAGARLAAWHADAWTGFGGRFEELSTVFEAELAAIGRARADVDVLVGLEVEDLGPDLDELTARWQERGASELIVHDVKPAALDELLARVQGGA
jgi:alkanesulfonate monooxygenase SsuD/methylene tetrahydromethanopterin reductase-like flavin-dependent oxidoreductase (luciferase family)